VLKAQDAAEGQAPAPAPPPKPLPQQPAPKQANTQGTLQQQLQPSQPRGN
jgi:hypothetical protein